MEDTTEIPEVIYVTIAMSWEIYNAIQSAASEFGATAEEAISAHAEALVCSPDTTMAWACGHDPEADEEDEYMRVLVVD